MKHFKIKARRKSEDDTATETEAGFISYEYDLELEIDGKPVEADNLVSAKLAWDVRDDVPRVVLEFIPETLEVDSDVPPLVAGAGFAKQPDFGIAFSKTKDGWDAEVLRGGEDVTGTVKSVSVSSSGDGLAVNVETNEGGFGSLHTQPGS